MKYQHKVGGVIYFESLKEYIILNPKWLANAFRCLVSDKFDSNLKLTDEWKALEDTGQLEHSLIAKLFDKEPELDFNKHSDHLLNVMEIFGIIVKLTTLLDNGQRQILPTYYMPCMISEKASYTDIIDLFNAGKDNCKRTPWLCIEFDFMPFDFFNHILCYYISQYLICTEPQSGRMAIYHGMGVFFLDRTKFRKFILCFCKNTVALQIWQWNNIEEGKCKSILEELRLLIERVKEKFETRKVSYIVKLKCPDGNIHKSVGRISYKELVDLGNTYFCEEHSDSHNKQDFFQTWFQKYTEDEKNVTVELEENSVILHATEQEFMMLDLNKKVGFKTTFSGFSAILMSAENPSTSVEADSDFDEETELPFRRKVITEDVYRKLRPRERKRQDVIHELFYTEKTHVKKLKILVMIFYKPMVADSVNDYVTKALFPNIEEILKLHSLLNEDMKKKRKENAVVVNVADILVKRFDGENGQEFRECCAIYCRNQEHALETLKARQKKDSRLANFLATAESSDFMRNLKLKDLILTEMGQLKKYPLLIESLLKYTTANSEEYNQLNKALLCSRHMLEYVNEAVNAYQNRFKLAYLQRKMEKQWDGLQHNEEGYLQIEELDLTKHKLVYDGSLTWNINLKKTIDVHAVLVEDKLVLLQKQDEKLVLKFRSAPLVAGKDDTNQMYSPLLELSSVLASNNKATDKRAFFVVTRSQIYEFKAHSSEEQKKWVKLIKDSADTHKRNKALAHPQPQPTTSPGRTSANTDIMSNEDKENTQNNPTEVIYERENSDSSDDEVIPSVFKEKKST